MRRTGMLPPLLVVALGVAVGCSSRQSEAPLPPHYTAKVTADLEAPPGTYPAAERDAANALAVRPASATEPRPFNVLAVSGGGQYGAYAAGLLVGWTCRGDRPDFDVVTGISSGALIAIFSFLGPKYDPQLTRYFTQVKTEDIFVYRPIVVHVLRDKSLATSDPLKELVVREVSEELMADLRVAHAAGRRLFIGTMDLNTRKLVVWDLGAIACSGRPDARELVRKITLASSSIAGLVPPVPIDVEVNGCCHTELHVDGGGVAQTFVKFGENHPRFDPANPTAKWLAGGNLYTIAGGKLYLDPTPGVPGFLGRVTGNISATLYALFRADAWRLYSLCSVSGMRFNMTAVPDEAEVHPRSTTFDPPTMRRLFTMGYDFGARGGPWRGTPPGYEPGEEEYPRRGTRFGTGQ